MKKITLVILLFVLNISSVFSYEWPWARNYNGAATPEQPSTIYIGDQGTFGHDSWADNGGKWPRWQVVIHTSADINNGTYGDMTAYSNVQHKTALSPRFTSTGEWYWGMKVEYTDADGITAWYCRNDANWYSMWGTPTSNLTITVSPLENPSTPLGTQASSSSIDLSWTKSNEKNVMILRKKIFRLMDRTNAGNYL